MKIFPISDLHSKKAITALTVPSKADVIVIAGDLEHPQLVFEHFTQFGLPIIAVAGNHDFYGREITEGIEELKQLASRYGNVYVLENESIQINDVLFIGSTFWSNYGDLHPRLVVEAQYNMMDSRLIFAEKWWKSTDNEAFGLAMHEHILSRGKSLTNDRFNSSINHYLEKIDKIEFHPIIGYQLNQNAVKFISQELAKPFHGKKVVISHHPPTWEALRQAYNCEPLHADLYNDLRFTPPGYDQNYPLGRIPEPVITSNYGSSLGDHFHQHTRQLKGADVWIHGHTHFNFEYALKGTRFVVNALGRNYCPIEKVESKLIDFEDGLNHAFENAIRRAVSSLSECIEALQAWASCEEIEQLSELLIREAVLDKIEATYSGAKSALKQFVDELNNGIVTKEHLTLRSLFNIMPNTLEFAVSLFEKGSNQGPNSEYYDPYMLSTDHIKEVVTRLVQIKDTICSKDWLKSLIEQTN